MKIKHMLAATLLSTVGFQSVHALASDSLHNNGFVQSNIKFASATKDGAADQKIVLVSFESCDCTTETCDSGCDLSCDSLCDDSCDSFGSRFGGLGDCGLLGYGIIKKSDVCFNDFISPMTNPVFFEDPRNLTEARAIFLSHQLPAGLGGNSVQVFALQVRAAITDRLSIIATKDGLIYTQSPVLESGLADIAAGLKYNLYRDTECGRLLSVGGTYEIPIGSEKSLQGNGDGLFNFFAAGGTRLGVSSHWISTVGLLEPADESAENRMMYWSNHLDKRFGKSCFYGFAESNWYNYLSSANAFPLPVEGGDLFNLGSPESPGMI